MRGRAMFGGGALLAVVLTVLGCDSFPHGHLTLKASEEQQTLLARFPFQQKPRCLCPTVAPPSTQPLGEYSSSFTGAGRTTPRFIARYRTSFAGSASSAT
jgi:hypothetical protein